MDIIRYALDKPVSVAVGVILVLLFGTLGLKQLPIQLTPDVETPQITVGTSWSGATPYEVEKEIIEPQEEALKGLQGLSKMESASYNSFGEITLSFQLATNLDDALLRVSNKLNEVADYPETAREPVIEAAGAQSSPVIWMVIRPLADNPTPINHFRTFFEDSVRQHLERVPGVGSLFVFGGTENQLEVIIDPQEMARYDVSIDQLSQAVQQANVNIAAGVLGIEKKNYRIRTVSQFQRPEDLLKVVIRDDGTNRVYLGDVARVAKGHEKEDVSVLHNGSQVIVIGVRREQGANVLEMSDRLEKAVQGLNTTLMADKGLYIDWVYDQRPYINRAIALVKNNVFIGGLLAIGVLLLFLRSIRSTATIATAIPVSAIGAFILLWLTGRNLNVVSLAGISFAVGMLVDNSIVVLENIDRHRHLGKSAWTAAYDGTREVWGAIFASTATTVAVFLPVVFIQEEAGQLFRDIAIAITSSILLSLVVSISVIPTMINLLYRRNRPRKKNRLQQSRLGPWLAGMIMALSSLCMRNLASRILSVVGFTAMSLVLIVSLLPSAEYLPQGNRNLILNILIPPPGYSVEKMKDMGRYIYQEAAPYFQEDNRDGIPQMKQMFYVGADRINLFGGISIHETRAKEMMPVFNRIMQSIPGIFGVSIQAGIFESGIGKGRTVEINISGEQIEPIVAAARTLFGMTGKAIPGAQVRPVPSLETSYPEVKIHPDKEKMRANGLSESDLGIYVDILMDGRKIDEYRPEGTKQVDLVLKGDETLFLTPEDLLNATIVSRYGDLVRIGDLATLEYSQGMPQINHLERNRTITLQVTPPAELALQEAMEIIEGEIIAPLAEDGKLTGVTVSVGGNADKLSQTRQALQWNMLLAVVITYLLMAALFENFFYPLIILFTVPLAAAGGLIGLRCVNALIAPQPMDILSMLGFIILIGTVVNNAILIVHQSLNNVRYNNFSGTAAISDAVRTRIRPIFMSATTSVLAMSPLVIATGSGSELYRGLGSILLGGLALSTLFTLFVIPSLLTFFIHFERPRNQAKEEPGG
ncbi:efflux RND transporter permease subunit [Desulfogranum mediterraneum]|uniref:efflux RND transporter permease subunit n=1 Tax=Desulfogranum mediterraneum TaxID=160661 RepID=UPI000426AAB8|nr:efflux RND transporter permease subunit [Desulfogranum mediterraneum]